MFIVKYIPADQTYPIQFFCQVSHKSKFVEYRFGIVIPPSSGGDRGHVKVGDPNKIYSCVRKLYDFQTAVIGHIMTQLWTVYRTTCIEHSQTAVVRTGHTGNQN